MSKNETAVYVFGTIICSMLVIFFATYVPYKIVTSENNVVIEQLDTIRFIGPCLIFIGIIGYLLCCWNFIFDARGIPLGDGQKNLIVKGLYRYVRNPMYLSYFLIITGEAIFFCSLHLLFYLLAWIVYFHFHVKVFEETWLREKFGESYEEYCIAVQRWIPRFNAYTFESV